MNKIIGRELEINQLDRLYHSERAEFVAVFGRRRVGKTFLIREYFDHRFAFYHTGISPAELKSDGFNLRREQLRGFCTSLQQYGGEWEEYPKDWFEAFDCLKNLLDRKSKDEKQVVFIDELPWLGIGNPGFLSALEHFWNSWGAAQSELLLIVCGSAASWMNDNIINNHGGLYGRITDEIHLSPFTLCECEQFYESRHISMDRYDQIQSYMVFGGIPYYLDMIRPEKSLSQNIDHLFFIRTGRLRTEFERLYRSLFDHSDKYMEIIRSLAQRRLGYTRKEIAEKTEIAYNGRLSNMLNALENSGFIISYRYFGGNAKDIYYKLVDNYSLFYLQFVDGKKNVEENFWTNNLRTPQLNTWRGLAFEDVCLQHHKQIKKALGFSAVACNTGPWLSAKGTAQVDLLFDRSDRVITLCEMKFSGNEFSITQDYDEQLRNKTERFIGETSCRKSVQLALVTTYGLERNKYAGRFQSVVTLDALFDKL
ncbi:MAG: ATP-binding protein [Bacteroidales bacterium]|nr:ATP-binding protein [Bacteroidales bacterium]